MNLSPEERAHLKTKIDQAARKVQPGFDALDLQLRRQGLIGVGERAMRARRAKSHATTPPDKINSRAMGICKSCGADYDDPTYGCPTCYNREYYRDRRLRNGK